MPAKIRKGDKVIVISGRDKGKRGEVLRVYPEDERVLQPRELGSELFLRGLAEELSGLVRRRDSFDVL